MARDLSYYLKKFSRLRVSRNRERGVAPHKPVLLLSVLEHMAQGTITTNEIRLSPELISSFLKYWGIVCSTQHDSNIAMPFFHMRGERFWHLQAKPGYENVVKSRGSLRRTLTALQEAVSHARLDEELFQYCCDAKSRESMVGVLVSTWFPDKAEQIARAFNVDSFGTWVNSYLQSGGRTYVAGELTEDEYAVRSSTFRGTIVSIYDSRCVICRMKANDHLAGSVVDGSHIKPFHLFFDDKFDNGLSLCKNHHWAFDKGWVAIDDNYRVLVTRHLHEDVPGGKFLIEYAGLRILTPAVEAYVPRLEAIGWHREKVFLGG